jgi:NAD(P)-dependent dehydrogenase (short-subunit alcohol dehydrogenase family)
MTTIVITGASSGIGQGAAAKLVARGHTVIAGARGAGCPKGVETRPLDLGDLDKVRGFAATLSDTRIDALVLNAGLQAYEVQTKTAQGFERTFGVNHLAHYLLARLLLPRIADGGTLLFTASGTHDPAEGTGVPPPRHADAKWLADPKTDPNLDARAMTAGMRAYSTSKLCNVMTARSFAALPEATQRKINVVAYDPGLTPGTGLVRDTPFVVRRLIWPLLPLVQPFSKGMNTLDQAAGCLADLADRTVSHRTDLYCALRGAKPTWPRTSVLSRDEAACAALWRDSAVMVGLEP